MVVDLRARVRGATWRLYEIKSIQYSTQSQSAHYYPWRGRAVNRRADKVAPERLRQARLLDETLYPDHRVGPVSRQLHALGGVTPLVVGAFAERNKAAHELLADIAKMSRQRISRDFLVDAAAARSLATWHLTQRFGCSAWSALEALQVERVGRFMRSFTTPVAANQPFQFNYNYELHGQASNANLLNPLNYNTHFSQL